ncbi:uncharacterized protein LOC132755047 [Ruditapes philippinarum]|uniref:uncharacterized protein LOC132755047 n=1 Tax=Ruditapes philippinarum TaxID=129788 RepID=UPI00295A83C2|nr:uncharacterized protein LOC132755047 [Ruditapes philippinarum]
MASNESPNVPFTILRTRFKRAPRQVIYDNACKLHEYCLNRDPLFFKETEFYIDRLHLDNHTTSLVLELQRYNSQDDELSFFPCLPKYRSRGRFQKDASQVKNKVHCTKKYAGHPSLLPGVFTIFCPHGIYYGFQVMASNESPNVPFTILRTRFKRAPRQVIYDNACKLHEYCLNRDPLFFKETEFYIDRLHLDNHTSCSYGYNLSMYPELEKLNSQCNEQANTGLKRIKDQLSYMTA